MLNELGISVMAVNGEELSKPLMDRRNHRERSDEGYAARYDVSLKAVGNRFYEVNVDQALPYANSASVISIT